MYVPAWDTLLRGVRGPVLATNRRKLSMIADLLARLKVARNQTLDQNIAPDLSNLI